MLRIFKSLLTLTFLVFVCCSTNTLAQINAQQPDTSKKSLNFRQLALGEGFIDIDTSLIHSKSVYQDSMKMNSIYQMGKSTRLKQLVSRNDLIPFMAATYRFYKHLKIMKGLYVNTLSSGKDIQISEEVFVILKSNMNELNIKIKAIVENGGRVEMPDIDNYLKWMLEHDWSMDVF